MKFHYKDGMKMLISMECIDTIWKQEKIDETNGMHIYEIDNNALAELQDKYNILTYLDHFVLLLPYDYEKQQQLWKNFYRYFGTEYEEIINRKHNLSCIQMMLERVGEKKESNKRILDFGCGCGLSIETDYAGEIIGYEPIEEMRKQAEKRGMRVLDESNIYSIPDDYFDAVIASYVFHMAILESDILRMLCKVKKDAMWVANFYKGINENNVNALFVQLGFEVSRVKLNEEIYGNVYEYRKKL